MDDAPAAAVEAAGLIRRAEARAALRMISREAIPTAAR